MNDDDDDDNDDDNDDANTTPKPKRSSWNHFSGEPMPETGCPDKAPCYNCMLAVGIRVNWFHVCSSCGNKRCPRAASHELSCTDSNEPGQKGSLYENCR